MTGEDIAYQVTTMLQATMVLAGPMLVVTALIGLVIGLIQAVTQIQDQTFPQTVKVIAATALLAAFGSGLAVPLYNRTEELFASFYLLAR
ncbi:MAG: flagellar biosynthetic protein FliQ [Hyphomicrobiaceae bacterium]|nr:flagellar biosynthetic protein FliQ [Hyphomicrobiaceae bacterium]